MCFVNTPKSERKPRGVIEVPASGWIRRVLSAPGAAALVPLVLCSTLGWAGRTDVTHVAATASESGVRKLRAGDVGGAVRSLKHAAALAPLQAQAWMDLAAAVGRQPGRLDEAIADAERAVQVPFSSAWADPSA